MLTGPIMEYEKILCGTRAGFSATYINLGTDPNIIREVLRYAVEEILCWTPEEMAVKFDGNVISRLHLDPVTRKVRFPNDLDRDRHTFYYADFAYPGTCRKERREAAMEYYKSKILNSRRHRWRWFPSEKENDIYLFNFLEYALTNNAYGIDPESPAALYRLFGLHRRINAFLKEFGLLELCLRQYLYPIDMLQDYLSYKGMEPDQDLYLFHRCEYFLIQSQIEFKK